MACVIIAACILFKKSVDTQKKGLTGGFWDAIHVVEVRPQAGGKAHYKLTSTIMLSLSTDHSTKSSGAPARAGAFRAPRSRPSNGRRGGGRG